MESQLSLGGRKNLQCICGLCFYNLNYRFYIQVTIENVQKVVLSNHAWLINPDYSMNVVSSILLAHLHNLLISISVLSGLKMIIIGEWRCEWKITHHDYVCIITNIHINSYISIKMFLLYKIANIFWVRRLL